LRSELCEQREENEQLKEDYGRVWGDNERMAEERSRR